MEQEVKPKVNGKRLDALMRREDVPAALRSVSAEEALAIVRADPSMRMLLEASMSSAQLIEVLKQALGPAEAEIEYTERTRYRED